MTAMLLACATCFDPNETSQALLQATVFLSLTPLAMIGFGGWFLYRRVMSNEADLPPRADD